MIHNSGDSALFSWLKMEQDDITMAGKDSCLFRFISFFLGEDRSTVLSRLQSIIACLSPCLRDSLVAQKSGWMQMCTPVFVFLQGSVSTTGTSLILLSLQPSFLPCVGRWSPKLLRISCGNVWELEIKKEINYRKRWIIGLRGLHSIPLTGLSENKALNW